MRLLSTPKLSTLNGHEATLTSGETQYYKEVQNNYYGTQNPISVGVLPVEVGRCEPLDQGHALRVGRSADNA